MQAGSPRDCRWMCRGIALTVGGSAVSMQVVVSNVGRCAGVRRRGPNAGRPSVGEQAW